MIHDLFSMGVIVMQSVLLIVLFGFLTVKYFGKDFRTKSDVALIFFAFLFWFAFFFLRVYEMILSPGFITTYLSVLSFIGVIVLFSYLNFKYTYLIDWFLVIPEYILLIALIVFIFIFGYTSNFAVLFILAMSSVILIVGYFIAIRFFIHRGKGL